MQKEIIIIVAYLANNRGIGFQGNLPWKPIPADMARFKKETAGSTVIMGRDTWLSIPEKFRPLAGRQNIIVSKTLDPHTLHDNVILVHTIDQALTKSVHDKIFMIGGEGIYKEVMERSIANTLMATIIHDNLDCDRFFPAIPNHWKIVYQGTKSMDPTTETMVQFVTFKNIRNSFPLGT